VYPPGKVNVTEPVSNCNAGQSAKYNHPLPQVVLTFAAAIRTQKDFVGTFSFPDTFSQIPTRYIGEDN